MSRAFAPSMLRRILVAAGFASSFGSLAATALAGDWYVDAQASDCVNADGSLAAPFCTIGAAILVAASSDTIRVAPGTYAERLAIDRSLHLLGTGGASVTTVDGGGLDSVVVISGAAAVELTGLTITHGRARYGGGVNVGAGCSATIDACLVTANQADAVDGLGARVPSSGGGIFASQATVVVAASTFSDNFASEGGGGIRSESGSLTVSDSTFSRNLAGDAADFLGGGGAIDGYGIGVLRVARSNFDSNRSDAASGYGGGAISSSVMDFVGDHLLLHDNVTPSGGGAIVAAYGMTLRDSTVEDNSAGDGGGLLAYNADSIVERCAIRGNRAFESGYDSHGGGILGQATLTDCLIEDNAVDVDGAGRGVGGGLYLNASSSLLRCVVRGNSASSSLAGGLGGGVSVDLAGVFNFTDCAITGNTATCAATGTAGSGGGMEISHFGPFPLTMTVTRCTIAGNAASGHDVAGDGDGGGIRISSSGTVPTLSHVVIADNTCVETGGAPDFSGEFQSSGFNLIGNTTGCTITGDGTGNQLDVDPLFADPGLSDFSLRSDSPAIDAGDGAVRIAGTDAAGHPRVVDGDLDRKMVLDLGAFEFDNVSLAISGSATPGGTLTFTTTGTAGLPILMLVGTGQGELLAPPFGTLFLDLSAPWFLLPWGSVPDQQSWGVDASIPAPSEWIFQPLVLDAATRAGNLGNAVVLDFQ